MNNNSGLSDELLELITETPSNEEYEGRVYNHVFESQRIVDDYDELWNIYFTQDGVLYDIPVRRSGTEWEGEYFYDIPTQCTQHGLAQAILSSDDSKLQKLVWKVMQNDEPRLYVESIIDEMLDA